MRIARLYTEAIESIGLRDWEKRVAIEFGGFTKYKGQGAYLNQSKRLQFETSYTFEIVGEFADHRIREIAKELGVVCGQESVLAVFLNPYDARLVYTEVSDG